MLLSWSPDSVPPDGRTKTLLAPANSVGFDQEVVGGCEEMRWHRS